MKPRDPLTLREGLVYLLIAAGSLLLISYLPHMFIGGLVEEETETKIQIGVTAVWAIGLAFLGWDIVRRRRQ